MSFYHTREVAAMDVDTVRRIRDLCRIRTNTCNLYIWQVQMHLSRGLTFFFLEPVMPGVAIALVIFYGNIYSTVAL
ncbi:MAG: hypothetical protein DSY50_03955 [Desulfobulbus sp.]|nr:MAG: hypothetical protein DSY50_03955 [Desulfobulbus sp.]